MEIKNSGTSKVFRWDKDYLFQVLTGGRDPVIADPKLAAAFRKIDRADFVPHKLRDQAYIDADLDIGYSQKLTRPTFVGAMLQQLQPKFGGTYLDLGTGAGFFAVWLAIAIGKQGTVYSLERVQWLWEFARDNVKRYEDEVGTLKLLYRDGLEGLQAQSPFDGIHLSFAVEDPPENLKMQLKKDGGRMVVPTVHHDIRVIERNGEDFVEEIVPGFVFQEGESGTV